MDTGVFEVKKYESDTGLSLGHSYYLRKFRGWGVYSRTYGTEINASNNDDDDNDDDDDDDDGDGNDDDDDDNVMIVPCPYISSVLCSHINGCCCCYKHVTYHFRQLSFGRLARIQHPHVTDGLPFFIFNNSTGDSSLSISPWSWHLTL